MMERTRTVALLALAMTLIHFSETASVDLTTAESSNKTRDISGPLLLLNSLNFEEDYSGERGGRNRVDEDDDDDSDEDSSRESRLLGWLFGNKGYNYNNWFNGGPPYGGAYNSGSNPKCGNPNKCPSHACRYDPAVIHGYCCGCAQPYAKFPFLCPLHSSCPTDSKELCNQFNDIVQCCCPHGILVDGTIITPKEEEDYDDYYDESSEEGKETTTAKIPDGIEIPEDQIIEISLKNWKLSQKKHK